MSESLLLQWSQETLKEMAEKNSAPLEINRIQDLHIPGDEKMEDNPFYESWHVKQNLHVPGAKDDASKPPVALVFESFPRALLEVAKVAGYGCQKYTRGGWKTVPDAITRYSDAGARHELYRHIEGETDPESGLLHLAHQAWNVLATLEKTLEKN